MCHDLDPGAGFQMCRQVKAGQRGAVYGSSITLSCTKRPEVCFDPAVPLIKFGNDGSWSQPWLFTWHCHIFFSVNMACSCDMIITWHFY